MDPKHVGVLTSHCRQYAPLVSVALVFLLIGARKFSLVGVITKHMVVVVNVRMVVGALAAQSWFPRVRRTRPWMWLTVESLIQFSHLDDQG